MITIAEFPDIKVYWYDEQRTILVGQLSPGWIWENAKKCVDRMNDTISVWIKTQPIYVILDLSQDAHHFPAEGSALKNLRDILSNDPQEETLTVFVAKANIVGNMIQLASRMYRMVDAQSKFRYVTTFDHALDVIHDHKSG